MVIGMSQYTGYDTPNGTIRFTIEGGYPPMDYLGDSGEYEGFEVELLYMVAKELGTSIEVSVTKYSSFVPEF